jgi:hypothetical protein
MAAPRKHVAKVGGVGHIPTQNVQIEAAAIKMKLKSLVLVMSQPETFKLKWLHPENMVLKLVAFAKLQSKTSKLKLQQS